MDFKAITGCGSRGIMFGYVRSTVFDLPLDQGCPEFEV